MDDSFHHINSGVTLLNCKALMNASFNLCHTTRMLLQPASLIKSITISLLRP